MSRETEVIRPGTIVVTLVLMSISTLFLGLSAAYLYSLFSSQAQAPLPPLLFFVNIPVLYGATHFLKKAMQSYDEQVHARLTRNLKLCLFLTLVFTCFQIAGWWFFFSESALTVSQARSFLFVLSGIHLLHVLAGIPFLVRFLWAHRSEVSSITAVPSARRHYLRGLIRYWNFLDVLWILLVVMLVAGYALRWVYAY